MSAEHLINREKITAGIREKKIILTPKNEIIELSDDIEMERKILSEHGLLFETKDNDQEKRKSTLATEFMVNHKWLSYDGVSQNGHYRFFQKGVTVRSVLENMFQTFAQEELSATKLITPIICDWNEEAVRKEVGTFHEDLYFVNSGIVPKIGEEKFLRFGCDVGIFRTMSESCLKSSHLPLRVFETGTMFRSHKSGERINIQRADSFTLPSVYSFCEKNYDQALDEFKKINDKFSNFIKDVEMEYFQILEMEENFFEQNRDWIYRNFACNDNSVLINNVSTKRHYYELKSDHIINGAFKSFNMQLDNENPNNYLVKYDKDGAMNECLAIHSTFGSTERWMLIYVENFLKNKEKGFPFWLSPVQIRLIPMAGENINGAVEIAHKIHNLNLRVDVDDREDINFTKRISLASDDVVPFTILWGRKEDLTNSFNLRTRRGDLVPININNLKLFLEENSKQLNTGAFADVPVFRLSKIPEFIY